MTTAIEKVSDSVYHLPEVHGGPTILLGDGVVLVDTGVPGSETAILAAVEELGRTAGDVTDIVITHADGDHVGSLAALVEATGATVWASAQEAGNCCAEVIVCTSSDQVSGHSGCGPVFHAAVASRSSSAA